MVSDLTREDSKHIPSNATAAVTSCSALAWPFVWVSPSPEANLQVLPQNVVAGPCPPGAWDSPQVPVLSAPRNTAPLGASSMEHSGLSILAKGLCSSQP